VGTAAAAGTDRDEKFGQLLALQTRSLCARGSKRGAGDKTTVKASHDEGIGVILDARTINRRRQWRGPTLSFRGIDNALITVSMRTIAAITWLHGLWQLIQRSRSIRCVIETHVDGFRFDLARRSWASKMAVSTRYRDFSTPCGRIRSSRW
jgi:hypothetical protein